MIKKTTAIIMSLVMMVGTFMVSTTASAATTAPVPDNTVYILVVAADFNNDGEKQLKEYFNEYKNGHEKYLGEKIIYDWHYYSTDKIPKSLHASIIENYDIDAFYNACVKLFGQKYWQRVLVSYDMEGGEIAPYSKDYYEQYGYENYVLLMGFYGRQNGIHGECHLLEGKIEYLNSELYFEGNNGVLKPNDKLCKFFLENGTTHFVVQKDIDRYIKQYGHDPVKWNESKWAFWCCNSKTNGTYNFFYTPQGSGTSVDRLYEQNPNGIYWYDFCSAIGGDACRLQHELELMQRLQDTFGVTLASITPKHPQAKIPTTSAENGKPIQSIAPPNVTPVTLTVPPTNSKVIVNDEIWSVDAYNIGGNNYFKLRDVAYILSGTKARFNVDYVDGRVIITKGQDYLRSGQLAPPGKSSKTAVPGANVFYIDGAAVNLTAYLIDGSNYVKLRDIGTALDFNVDYNGDIIIRPDRSYAYIPLDD